MPYFTLIFSLFFLSSCANTEEHKQTESREAKTVKIHSVKELNMLFEDLNYTSASLRSGHMKVPRIYFSKVTQNWKQTSESLPVKEKKSIFFRLLSPLVLRSNEEIKKERTRLLNETKDSEWTKALAHKYKVLKETDKKLTSEQLEELKKRVDIIPTSLALAQGAEESGWGTSRFAAQGNALFGQWDFSGNGMRPVKQRKELGDYGLAKFDTALEAVQAYMLNLNTTFAYEELRTLRQELRLKKKKITGWALAATLGRYSEKGQDYIDGLHHMISYNKLQATDDAVLDDGPSIHLVKAN